MKNARTLLKEDASFIWTTDIQKAFKKTKEILTGDLLVKPFDERLTTNLLTDASCKNGLGYILMQKEKEDGKPPRIIQ